MSNTKVADQWFRHVLDTATSLGGLRSTIALAVEELGFRYFVVRTRSFVHTRVLRRSGDILLSNAPLSTRDLDRELKRYPRFRDLTRSQLSVAAPTLWRDLAEVEPVLMARLSSHGMMTGCTHVVHGHERDWSLVTFIMGEAGAAVERRIDAALPLCQLFACHVHDAIARVALPNLSAARPTQAAAVEDGLALSPRERQCLTLAGVGLTAAEIARQLGIAERTTVYHLMVARRKLGASKTRQAFTKAVALGLISARG